MATEQKIAHWLNIYNAAWRRIGEAEALGNEWMKRDCGKLGDTAIRRLEALGVATDTLVRDKETLTWGLPDGTVAKASM